MKPTMKQGTKIHETSKAQWYSKEEDEGLCNKPTESWRRRFRFRISYKVGRA